MYSDQAIEFKEYYTNTHNRWLSLLKNVSINPTVDWGTEFNELVKVTMELFLDVRKFDNIHIIKSFIYLFNYFQFRLANSELIETETKEFFSKTLMNLLKTSENKNMRAQVELLRSLDVDGKWDSDYGIALLSGKVVKRLQSINSIRCKNNLNTLLIHILNSILIFQMI